MSSLKKLGLLNRQGMLACNEGRCEDALFQLTQADRLARSMESPLHEAKVRNNMGVVYQMNGKFEEARVCFRMAADRAVAGAGDGNCLHRTINRNLDNLLTRSKGAEA
ncbi:MAG: tetratricopeptide repeat protein [Pseudodesulfovibrio sp.]|uniref:tetratricopeptide repeat protein n=1 Tax=Pseudodesulfovibrio sp. TaxID=2035812 RepID=UPI003D100268